MSLWSDFVTNDGLLTTKSVHYFPIYERYFSRFRNLDVTVFEIGVWQGGSLKLWKKYFGPNATIVGLDINEQCVAAEENQIFVRVGNQCNPEFLDRTVSEFGIPDIVIDDGSHLSADINATFEHLYPKLGKNSVYLVEDTFLCYRDDADVVAGSAESFMEKTKSLIDFLHAKYSHVSIPQTPFTDTTYAIHVYDSVVVFEKQRKNRRIATTGRTQIFGPPVDNARMDEEHKSFLLG